jgi:uncharacterized protein (TIGR00730 family)
MSRPYRVAVFCSASSNISPFYFVQAGVFSKGLASRGWELIYGGAANGLMGHLADEALKVGGTVRGAIPKKLMDVTEVPHKGLKEMVVTENLFERKSWMMDNADAYAIFPGGLGTLDEALEVLTWKSLDYHQKPIVFVNINGFWQHQIKVFQQFAIEGMIRTDRGLSMYDVSDTAEEALAAFDAYHVGGKTH